MFFTSIAGLKLVSENVDGGYDEPLADNPPCNGGEADIDLFFFKKHAPALSRVLSFVEEDDVKGLFLDEEAFASFVYYCLSTTIKKGTWRIGRNKKIVSQLFTPYVEGLALVLLENNAEGIRDILANGRPDKKKKIKTKYTCKGFFQKSQGDTVKRRRKNKPDGGQGWNKAGMKCFFQVTELVKESRESARRKSLEQTIKQSYVIQRSSGDWSSDDDEVDRDSEDDSDDESVYICTGIPI